MSDAPRTYTNKKPIFVIDFDGVLHGYESGWKGATVVPDKPVPGALEFLQKIRTYFEINVFSSRSHEPGGIPAMQQWLIKAFEDDMAQYNVPNAETRMAINDFVLSEIKWPVNKPPAKITLDDRAIRFTGSWPQLSELTNFKTWQQK